MGERVGLGLFRLQFVDFLLFVYLISFGLDPQSPLEHIYYPIDQIYIDLLRLALADNNNLRHQSGAANKYAFGCSSSRQQYL